MRLALLFSALTLSVIAAYFSIVGLSTIFPGSITSIVTMAVALEAAKIIVAVWTHLNWEKISILTKSYLCFAVFVLMGITSGGIFGFLSKSHIEHNSSSTFLSQEISEIERKIALQEEKIKREQSSISKKQLNQEKASTQNKDIEQTLQSNIDSIYARLDKETKDSTSQLDKLFSRVRELDSDLSDLRNQKVGLFSSNSKKIQNLEEAQKEERLFLNNEIKKITDFIDELKTSSQKKVEELREEILNFKNKKPEIKIEDLELIKYYEDSIQNALSEIENLNLKKFDLNSKKTSIENELGPIKYIAELVSEFGGPEIGTERSIRLVIILIVLVFDPLAIVMVICASKQIIRPQLEKPKPQPKPEPKPQPKPEPKPQPKPKVNIEEKLQREWFVKKNQILKELKLGKGGDFNKQWFYRWVVSGRPNRREKMITVKDYNKLLKEKGGEAFLKDQKIIILKNKVREKDGYKWVESVWCPNLTLINI